jgi:uracil-DNA glycosylase
MIEDRLARLDMPHIRPLTDFVQALRERNPDVEYPYFDPLDGGINAGILFLFEKPGPMTAGSKGSGFISRDNNDPTAANTFYLMNRAGIPREKTVTWNLIPGWNGRIKITADERRGAFEDLEHLLGILDQVKIIVLVGRTAQRAKTVLEQKGLKIATSFHPSPKVKNLRPALWDSIADDWRNAYDKIRAQGVSGGVL